ncbi:sulfotransferase domain-containing protein [Streptomyces boncukensis]|uniref:Sulfotransferase domain-containing protein n=1 Tax=Streptomyces boncukensis TaxID=2711219 RepID=A0A6G4X5G0_9ACTN|nr:sulfotransferase domain-containing protein [Streptomyces boncukensis]NGO72087.1 sulfotransferase domain-containing protein [Streptomyces boncukensis]
MDIPLHQLPGPARRTYRTAVFDSTRWDRFRPRPDDIVISTPPKCGTTWMQRITACLVFGSPELPAPLREVSPWLEFLHEDADLDTLLARLEAQRHRRFLKSHLPPDALPPLPESASYLVVFRDLRDAALSFHHHMGRAGVYPELPSDPRAFWRGFFSGERFGGQDQDVPLERFTQHMTSWWRLRHEPGVLLLHYQRLLDDLEGEMRRVAAHLGIRIPEEAWPGLVAACGFEEMRADSERVMPAVGPAPRGAWFFHRGVSGQWRETVTERETACYEEAVRSLPAGLRAWLENPDGPPPDTRPAARSTR